MGQSSTWGVPRRGQNPPEHVWVLLEIRESENCDEVLKEETYEMIHDSSLNEKHDCNDIIINSIKVNCANNTQNPYRPQLFVFYSSI